MFSHLATLSRHGSFSLLKVKGRPKIVGALGHVWDMKWARDDPDTIALMEESKLLVIK